MHRLAVVIPAYQPEQPLLDLLSTLKTELPEALVTVVNDGSSGASLAIFDEISTIFPAVTVLNHVTNRGKGEALKTAFQYIVNQPEHTLTGVVTADADGQHAVADIKKVSAALLASPNALWLGVRSFDKAVPLRSRFGNYCTQKIFSFFTSHALTDTQTGLRGIPTQLLPLFLQMSTSGYEFELDMLMTAVKNHIPVKEVSIETIYIDSNRSSHFNPLIDSIKIYFVFIRYTAISLASAGLDFLLFSLFFFFSQHLFFSVTTARIFSGCFNFVLSKKAAFKSEENVWIELVKYTALAIFSLLVSYCLILFLTKIASINPYISKIISDAAIFFLNFVVQRAFVFSHRVQKEF